MPQAHVSRQEAIAAELPRYFTGALCKNGHVSERYTANKTCCECANATANKSKAKDRAKYSAISTAWGRANPEKVAAYQRARNKKYPAQRNFWTASYRAAKDARAPDWLTPTEEFEIQCVYAYCSGLRSVGLDYHVDHVVPLRGELVSGLHVPWNLQVIPARENMSKGNSFYG